ncbi:hypothetical protein [Candidatus Nitrosocosmicus sp. T]
MLREFYSRYIPEQIRYKEEMIQINPFYETEVSVRQVLYKGYKGYKGMNTDKIEDKEEDKEQKSLMIVDSLRNYSGQKNAESIWNANQEMVKYAIGLGKKVVSIMGDMGSFLFEKRIEELVNYELSLPRRFEINLKGICLYHQNDFDRLSEYQKQTIINLHEIAIRL